MELRGEASLKFGGGTFEQLPDFGKMAFLVTKSKESGSINRPLIWGTQQVSPTSQSKVSGLSEEEHGLDSSEGRQHVPSTLPSVLSPQNPRKWWEPLLSPFYSWRN